ncbi:glycoside hydrolase family 2 TIM barrel-domain containing protein [Lentzea sp. NPDC051208]|uniref:glycoside hydrolase family 2 TIM barrel-domain containing protein n=1 Tax=Lentzea sp. NPDC051208 TaxID=3154642 RepID=UPI00341C004A
MIRTSFNDGWQFRRKVSTFAESAGPPVPFEAVTLPHDALIRQERIRPETDHAAAGAVAYFPGGTFEYRKTFPVSEDHRGRRVLLEFEGVYRDAVVYVNGDYVGQRPYGYSGFTVDVGPYLKYGHDNEVRVEARAHQDSRWYSGAGIYRDTWLLVGDLVHVEPDGIRVTTPQIDAERAAVEVATTVGNDSIVIRTVEVITEIRDAAGEVVASRTDPLTVLPGTRAISRQRLYVRDPALWSPDSPALHSAQVVLREGDGEVDSDSAVFGIRTLSLDPVRGLQVNGETVKLRGACVHHDNGVLGAVNAARAEHRRVEILKAAGFNAIRMSHHPMSRAMLDACDRLGVLVVDETFDVWTSAKSAFDYSLTFPEWWERDVEAMVAKDFNHPSVVLYSIGNEIPEVGSPAGAAWSRKLAEKVRSLDSTRFVTNSVNVTLAVMADLAEMRERMSQAASEEQGGGINTLMATDAGAMMNKIAAADFVTQRTAEVFATVDVAGMNYADSRYEMDHELFPERIILGTETFPTRVDVNWNLVQRFGHVIGDFTWTGWDYLGEAGIGRQQYLTPESPRPEHVGPYPYLVAQCGDIDITGYRRPASYYREIVFGLRAAPYLSVRRPSTHGLTAFGSPWAWSDSIASWTWPGFEDSPVVIEVYSDADEVELLLNDRSLGRHPVGPPHRFRTEFEAGYEPGELVAVAYRDGEETGRHTLRTATGPVRLRAEVERPVIASTGGDLAYVALTLTDEHGTTFTSADRPVTLEVSGDGELLGYGSADPSTEERFDSVERRTWDGRALAVLRPTTAGKVRLIATAPDCEPVEVVVTVEQ